MITCCCNKKIILLIKKKDNIKKIVSWLIDVELGREDHSSILAITIRRELKQLDVRSDSEPD
jgi:hypothetical protein